MDWVKLRTLYYRDPKVAGLPDADTEMMFVRSLAYAGEQETGGFVPESVLPMLARVRAVRRLAKALIAAGLWIAVDGGYQITRWDDNQSELEALAKRRAADRERKRRKRAGENPQVTTLSADMSADIPRTFRGREEEKELPPYPPPSGGTPCPRHKRVRRGCAECAPPKPRPSDRTVADIFNAPTCEHGAPIGNGQIACALCRIEEAG